MKEGYTPSPDNIRPNVENEDLELDFTGIAEVDLSNLMGTDAEVFPDYTVGVPKAEAPKAEADVNLNNLFGDEEVDLSNLLGDEVEAAKTDPAAAEYINKINQEISEVEKGLEGTMQ
jgi:hypothetical protein